MFSKFERMIAFRYLRARRKEGFISVIAGFSLLGIALGVATLIVVLSVMDGFRTELIHNLLGMNGHISLYSYPAFSGDTPPPIENYDEYANEALQIDGVVSAAPLITGEALLSTPSNSIRSGNSGAALVRAMRAEDIMAKPAFYTDDEDDPVIVAGDITNFSSGSAIIGQRMSENMGLTIGDEFTLTSSQSPHVTAFGHRPRQKTFEVIAIFEIGMYEYDSSFVFIPISDGQMLFGQQNSVSAIELVLDNPLELEPVVEEINARLGRNLAPWTWKQSNGSFVNALETERNVMFIILTLLIIIAAFNIISGLIMLVNDKARNIAILRTIGASRGSILRIFFMTGAAIGVVGTALGVGLGVIITLNVAAIQAFIERSFNIQLFSGDVYPMDQLPAILSPDDVISVIIMALCLSFIATIYPALRAARLDPVEALRYE